MRVLDLFCGAVGGWSAGLRRAGYRTVAACEVDPWRRTVFAEQHPDAIMYPDVRELTAERLRADLGYLPEVVVGSPPCQEISAANSKGAGITDDHLFWEWARLVFEVRPVWCAAENSPRARTQGIDGILDALEQGRYAWWAHVVGADHAGANHQRRRLWVVAADAERLELWQQQGRGGGTDWRGAAVAGELNYTGDVGDADENDAAGQRPVGAFRGGPGSRSGGVSRDPARQRCGEGRPEPSKSRPGEDPGLCGDAGHAEGDQGMGHRRLVGRGEAEPAQAHFPDVPAHADQSSGRRAAVSNGAAALDRLHPDAAGARQPIGPGGNADELPPALRDIGLAWPDWNGGLAGLAAACAAAGFGALDDERDAALPAGMRNRAIAALGDAVVDKIPEVIGRAMMGDRR